MASITRRLAWMSLVAVAAFVTLEGVLLASDAVVKWSHPDWEFLPLVEGYLAALLVGGGVLIVACALGVARWADRSGAALAVVGGVLATVTLLIGGTTPWRGLLAVVAGAVPAGAGLAALWLEHRRRARSPDRT